MAKKIKQVVPVSGPSEIKKPIVKSDKVLRAEITRILYQNSSDDSYCMRIKFEAIDKVIDEIVSCVR